MYKSEELLTAIACKPTSTVQDVAEAIIRMKIHRSWVLDDEGRPIGVITLSDLINKFAPFDFHGHKLSP